MSSFFFKRIQDMHKLLSHISQQRENAFMLMKLPRKLICFHWIGDKEPDLTIGNHTGYKTLLSNSQIYLGADKSQVLLDFN